MRPLVGVCSRSRPDNGLDKRDAARDLLPLMPSSFCARLEDCADTPPLVVAYCGGRSLSAVEAVAYGEIRQRRIWSGKMIEVVSLQILGVFRASRHRQRHRQPPQGAPQPHRLTPSHTRACRDAVEYRSPPGLYHAAEGPMVATGAKETCR